MKAIACLIACLIVIGVASAVFASRVRHTQAATTSLPGGLLRAAVKSSDAPSKPVRDACVLLTREELSAGTSLSFVSAESARNGDDESSCNYAPGTGNIYPVTLTVTFRHGKAAMELIQGVAPSMVPGSQGGASLGDASFFLPLDVSVYALKGDVLVNIGFGLGAETKEQKIALVRKVLSRL